MNKKTPNMPGGMYIDSHGFIDKEAEVELDDIFEEPETLPEKPKKKSKPVLDRVAFVSIWANDERRGVKHRIAHLLDKVSDGQAMRWIWVVGDSGDKTEDILRAAQEQYPQLDITIIRHDTAMEVSTPTGRLERMSRTFSAGFDALNKDDTYVIIHESDLQSPRDVIAQFLDTDKDVIAGWVTLTVGQSPLFYDTWGYHVGGQGFTNSPPYHERYHKSELFEVDGVGSCWLAPVQPFLDGLRCTVGGARELCAGLKDAGYSIWVNPLIPIVQPVDLWVPQTHPNF